MPVVITTKKVEIRRTAVPGQFGIKGCETPISTSQHEKHGMVVHICGPSNKQQGRHR
jgi:hypothetical protein